MAWQKEMGWQRLDERGQERCIYVCEGPACLAAGAGGIAINGSGLVYEYRLEYSEDWVLARAAIVAHLGEAEFRLVIERYGSDAWSVDGVPSGELAGCTDLDIAFSASTKMPAIRRLRLEPGQEAWIRAAVVTEPELKMAVVDQVYACMDAHHYTHGTAQQREILTVDDELVVLDYPGLFTPALQGVGTP